MGYIMKSSFRILSCTLVTVILFAAVGLAQLANDYRTNGSGSWSSASIWQRYNGSSWVNASAAPNGTHTTTIQSADSVYFDVAVSIVDTLKNQGKMGGVDNLTITSTGVYQHDRDAGSLPVATWADGSTLLITGSVGSAPSNGRQNFYNVTFNTPGLTANLNLGWDSITIRGNITVENTGASRWQMAAPTANDSSVFSVMGDIIVTGGSYSSNGTSNANTRVVIHQYGNIVVTGGNLSVSRGSQGSGTGSTRWYLHNGNFSMTNATTQNSNPTNAWFVFDKPGTQTLTLGAGNTLTSLPIVVATGTTLDMGTSKLRGSGLFTLSAGATLATAREGGIDSALANSGTITLSPAANFIFNGSVPQVTGVLLPATVNDLTIQNAAGVTLTQALTIDGVLHLKSGVFDNTIAFTLGPSGSVSSEGGSLLVPLGVDAANGLPRTFFLDQNHPNPFNPSTTIRFGLPGASTVRAQVFDVTGRVVATLFNGRMEAGIHELRFEPERLSSGVYLIRVQAGASTATRQMVYCK